MSTLISSPFFFDNEDVRNQCVDALGLTEALIANSSNEIIVLTESTTLTSNQINKTILVNSASPTTITIPVEGSSSFGSYAQITIIGIGTGVVTIAPAANVVINTTETLVLRKRYSGVLLIKRTTDTWVLTGDTIPAVAGYITEVQIPEVNTSWVYVPIENPTIENISTKGIKPIISLGELYGNLLMPEKQFQNIEFVNIRGIPIEGQFDNIEILHLGSSLDPNIMTGFYIKNLIFETNNQSLNDVPSGLGNVTFDIGVSPFAFGDEKWILAGIRISFVAGVWSCSIIRNGTVVAGSSTTSVDPDQLIDVRFLNGSLTFTATTLGGVSTPKSALFTGFSQPLYSRFFLQGPLTDIRVETFSFDVALRNTVSNGQGKILPVRFNSLDGQIIEISAEVK